MVPVSAKMKGGGNICCTTCHRLRFLQSPCLALSYNHGQGVPTWMLACMHKRSCLDRIAFCLEIPRQTGGSYRNVSFGWIPHPKFDALHVHDFSEIVHETIWHGHLNSLSWSCHCLKILIQAYFRGKILPFLLLIALQEATCQNQGSSFLESPSLGGRAAFFAHNWSRLRGFKMGSLGSRLSFRCASRVEL